MFNLCIAELSEIIEGSVTFGAMPPLAGLFEPIGQIVVDVRQVQSRSILWTFGASSPHACYQAEEAFSRGAIGVVGTGRRIEPWAGKFCASVADPIAALHRLMRCLRADNGKWPEAVFGRDDAMQEMMRAVWQRDLETVHCIIQRIDRRATSAA